MEDKDVAAGGETPPVRTLDEFPVLLQRFIAEQIGPGAVLTDWFISFGAMQRDEKSPTGISYATRYLTSDSSPQGALGIAALGIGYLEDDLAAGRCQCHDHPED